MQYRRETRRANNRCYEWLTRAVINNARRCQIHNRCNVEGMGNNQCNNKAPHKASRELLVVNEAINAEVVISSYHLIDVISLTIQPF